jgi:hypothetical protein
MLDRRISEKKIDRVNEKVKRKTYKIQRKNQTN